MGAGGSKKLQVVQPQANVPAIYNSQEFPMQHGAGGAKPKVLQANWFSHERPEEHKRNQRNLAHDNTEWSVLHIGTLKRHKINYPEQADDLQTVFDKMQLLRQIFASYSRGPNQDTMRAVLENLASLVNTTYNTNTSDGKVSRNTRIVDFFIEIEGPEMLQKFALNFFNDYFEMAGEKKQEQEQESEPESLRSICFYCLHQVLLTILSFTDFHNGFCSASAQAGVVSMCLEKIVRLDKENDNWQNKDDESEPLELIEVCLGILHNISLWLRDRELFSNSDETLLYFAKVKKTKIATIALLCLAYLVTEETNHLISADENLLRFIVTMLNRACQSKDRRYDGFSAKELAEGLSHLAINDKNKKILGKNEAIRVLTSILRTSNDDEERTSGARALWMLAFDDSNKDVIRQEEGALDTLRELHHSGNPEVQKAAAGALWEIEGKKARNNADKFDKTKEVTGNHVMISYQWDSQDVLVEVKNKLQANGYRVWMDLEQMGGSTLDAMAKAVEGAAVVLVCVSQRYKESPNCRSEAEYTYELRKDVIPLMMQHNYKADGWLGILVGTKLRIGFQSKQAVDSGVAELIKELGGRGKDRDATDSSPEAVIRPSETSVVTAPRSVTDVSGWTNQDVKKWLTEIGLGQVCKEDISEFNGKTLIHLQKLRAECPDYFYKCLERTLRLETMFLVFKFTDELEKLFGH